MNLFVFQGLSLLFHDHDVLCASSLPPLCPPLAQEARDLLASVGELKAEQLGEALTVSGRWGRVKGRSRGATGLWGGSGGCGWGCVVTSVVGGAVLEGEPGAAAARGADGEWEEGEGKGRVSIGTEVVGEKKGRALGVRPHSAWKRLAGLIGSMTAPRHRVQSLQQEQEHEQPWLWRQQRKRNCSSGVRNSLAGSAVVP